MSALHSQLVVETVQPANKSESRCVILCVRISIHARSRRTNLFSIPICAQFRPVQRPCYLAAARALGHIHGPRERDGPLYSFSLHSFFFFNIFTAAHCRWVYRNPLEPPRSRISSYGAHRRGRSLTISMGSSLPPCVCNKRMSLNGQENTSRTSSASGVNFFYSSALGFVDMFNFFK